MVKGMHINLMGTAPSMIQTPGTSAFLRVPTTPPQILQIVQPGRLVQAGSLLGDVIGCVKNAGNAFGHFIGRSFDSFIGGFEMVQIAGIGLAIPSSALCNSNDSDDVNFARPMLFGAPNPQSGGHDPLRKSFFDRLKEEKCKDVSAVEKAFDILDKADTEVRQRNIKVARKMIDFRASTVAITAAILLGQTIPKAKEKALAAASDILLDAHTLRFLSCDYQDRHQVNHLRSLFFLMTKNHESILLLAAIDSTTLEDLPQDGVLKSPSSYQIASRSFFVTPYIMKYMGYNVEAGTIEDLGLLYMDPVLYREVEDRLTNAICMDRAASLTKLKGLASDSKILMDLYNLQSDIKCRTKGTASFKRKTEEKGIIPLDVNAIRVILKSNKAEDCYAALFAIREHYKLSSWEEVTDIYDDYIARPKGNGYQSIHIYFRNPKSGYVVEYQIRTEEMNIYAEIGPASHGLYKVGESANDINFTIDDYAPGMFALKRDSMIANGVHFVYDAETGDIVKLVTGSPNKSPTVIDFAFVKGLWTGLHVTAASVDGSHVSIQTPLSNSSKIGLRTGDLVKSPGRADHANTPFARAFLTLSPDVITEISKGTLDMDEVIRRGKTRFSVLVADIMTELQEYRKHFDLDAPTIKFSMARLHKRMGFDDIESLYAVLAVISHPRDKLRFEEQIKKRIRDNIVLVSLRLKGKSGKMEVMSVSDPDALRELLRYMEENNIELASLDHSQIHSSTYQISRLAFNYKNLNNAHTFVKRLEDLYWRTVEWPSLSPRKIELTITIRKSFVKHGKISEILKTLFDHGIAVRECTMSEGKVGKSIEYKLDIRLPAGLGQKARLQRLNEELKSIKGANISILA